MRPISVPNPDINTWRAERLSHWLVKAWGDQFTAVLRSLDLTGTPADVSLQPREPDPELWKQWRDPLWRRVPADLAEGAELFIGCAADTARGLAELITGETDLDEEATLETYAELLNQTAAGVAAEIASHLGAAATMGASQSAEEPAFTDLGAEFGFKLGESTHLLAFVPNETLLQSILSPPPGETPDADGPAGQTKQESGSEAGPGEHDRAPLVLSPTASYNLSMLMEVDLDLSVSFGRTQLPLEDVLKLGSGSIVELNRSASDPVDVLVNNSVVARGEVVIVEGNYGIRITEVVSRQERIRSIF